jgi:hypothetical protein
MAMGATKESATAAYDACERTESASPRSYWGAAQGMTRVSQESGFQDERYALDRIAAAILAKGRKLVAACNDYRGSLLSGRMNPYKRTAFER